MSASKRAFAVLLAGGAVFFFGEQLLLLQRRVARVGDDVILEVDHLFQARGFHVQQVAQPAGHGLEEPDMHDRRGQLDMAHPLAAHAAMRDLDAAAVADHPLVLHAAILAAGAFPVLFRAKDALAEQAVLFRTVGAVVDRFGLFHFAERPTADVVRPGQADLDRRVVVDPIVRAFADAVLMNQAPLWRKSLCCSAVDSCCHRAVDSDCESRYAAGTRSLTCRRGIASGIRHLTRNAANYVNGCDARHPTVNDEPVVRQVNFNPSKLVGRRQFIEDAGLQRHAVAQRLEPNFLRLGQCCSSIARLVLRR